MSGAAHRIAFIGILIFGTAIAVISSGGTGGVWVYLSDGWGRAVSGSWKSDSL